MTNTGKLLQRAAAFWEDNLVAIEAQKWTMPQVLTAFAAEVVSEAQTAYICGECGVFAYARIDSLDSGTTLTCGECGGKTIVDLDTPEKRSERYADVALPFTHADKSDCPTFYDGCNCTLQVLREAFDRIEALAMSHEGRVDRLNATKGER
jgi:DNA-directed RNA polymerase subunit RPC12/RpoP